MKNKTNKFDVVSTFSWKGHKDNFQLCLILSDFSFLPETPTCSYYSASNKGKYQLSIFNFEN
jgi:hypothetical protein